MNLLAGFAESVRRFPTRSALWVDAQVLTYEELGGLVDALSLEIGRVAAAENPVVAILAHRSVTAYAGVLAILAAGKGYVPLNPKFPAERLRRMLDRSGCDVLIVGEEGLSGLPELLRTTSHCITVMGPGSAASAEIERRFPEHRFVTLTHERSSSSVPEVPELSPGAPAYLLFTSGSTGDPKGVAVSHGNVTSYVNYICDRYDVGEEDRFSQHFDLTFDLSAHDMFVCWQRGACLYSIPHKSLIAPAKFIRQHELTMWFSVPSAVGFMQRMGMLQAGTFPSLRCSLFCGEPLPADFARTWRQAAPNSIVENLYGPTEATIAITAYRFDETESEESFVNGIVPIGWPFDGQQTGIVGDDGQPVRDGDAGELLLAGSQVTSGYWNDPRQTGERFVTLAALGEEVWYRTGDLARRGDDGCLYFLGRRDDQVKIRGYRVELQEIDHALRQAAETEDAVAVAWPVRNGSADGVVAFVCGGPEVDDARILAGCKRLLPDYMVPRKIHRVDALPLNVNGKIDRKRLTERLEGERQ